MKMKIDRDLADAVRNLPMRWRAWCNDCGTSARPFGENGEADADSWLSFHQGHDAGKVQSL